MIRVVLEKLLQKQHESRILQLYISNGSFKLVTNGNALMLIIYIVALLALKVAFLVTQIYSHIQKHIGGQMCKQVWSECPCQGSNHQLSD